KLVPLDVQVGDRILFGKYSGSDIKLDGEELLIMREDDVLGILEAQPKVAKKASYEEQKQLWQNKLFMQRIPGRPFCAASINWRTQSKSRWDPKAVTSFWRRNSAARTSPKTV